MSEVLSQQALQQFGEKLRQRHWRLACAESCTGGWLAKCCTDVAGSSDWFDRGFVTYSNQAKIDMLAVPAGLIGLYGAVSREVVIAMTDGCLQFSAAQMGVAISGIAGPGGGTPDKPVGTVWFGFALQGEPSQAHLQQFTGDRDAVRRQAVRYAFETLAGLI